MTNSESGSKNKIVLIIALSMCAIFGLLDIFIGLKSVSKHSVSIYTLLPPLAATTLIYLTVFLAGWYLIVGRLSKSFSLDKISTLISWGLFIGIPIIAVSLSNESFANKSTYGKLSALTFQTIFAAIAAILVYIALTKIFEGKKGGLPALKTALLIPVLIAETLFFSYLMQFHWHILVTGALIISVLVTLALFNYARLGISRALYGLIALVFLIFFAGGLSVLISQQQDLEIGKRTPHITSTEKDLKHVILISVDTLRTDVLSSYGSEKVKTPNIDGLSEDGVLFKYAYSSAPWTLPAFTSMMTGLPPHIHKTVKPKVKVPTQLKTTAEYMLDSGYHTGGIVRNVFLHPEYHMDQGFVDYIYYPKSSGLIGSFGKVFLQSINSKNSWNDVTTEEITDLSIDWLEKNKDKDFFFWVHYFDPHIPYAPPKKYITPNAEPPKGMGMTVRGANFIRSGHKSPNKEQREWTKELYDAEVRYVDDNIGRLIEYLKDSGLYDESLIIFTSDHGEEFWDHGGFEHGHTLYNEVIQVPLIVKLPGKNEARVEETRVSTQSIMRTILDAAGIEYEENDLVAGSLYPMVTGTQTDEYDEAIISTGLLYYEDREALIHDDMKYIRFLVTDKEEIYDLEQDPREKIDLENEAIAERSIEALRQYKNMADKLSSKHGVESAEEVVLSEDKKEKLKALDYIQ